MALVKMAPGEWLKPNSKTGEVRLVTLNKNLGKTKIPLVNGRDVIIADTPENRFQIEVFPELKKTFALRAKLNGMIKSSDIAKSAIFGGGGGGMGGGTVQTAQAESLQCLYCAAMTTKRNLEFEEITYKLLRDSSRRAFLGKTKLDDAYNLDAEWHMSAYWSAKALIDKGFINKRHSFHRDDPQMNKIYNIKKRAFANNNMPNLNNDKWNPGDIWAIESGIDIDKSLTDESVKSLNIDLQKAFDARKIVGISLKKVVQQNQLRLSVLNSQGRVIDTYRFEKASLMADNISTATFFRGKGGIIYVRGGTRIDVRTPTFLGPLNFEILGATARGGRAGFEQIVHGAKEYLKYTMPNNITLKRQAQAIVDKDAREIQNFYKMASKVLPSLTSADFNTDLAKQELKGIHTKLATTTIFFGLVKATRKQQDAFITYMVNYAGSTLQESSVYAKVYQ